MGIFLVFRKRRPRRYKTGRYRNRPRRRLTLPAVSRKTVARAILICMASCAVGLSCRLAYKGLCRSDFFRLTAITINGCHHLDKEQILEQSGLDIRTNLLAMSTEEIRQRIETPDWIDRATVTRKWPDKIFIMITERQPIAMVNLREGLCYLDKNFEVIAQVEPTITGLEDLSVPLRKEAGRPAALHDALVLVNQAGRGNSYLPCQNISEIHVTEQGELVLYLLDQVFPIYLGRDGMKVKYWRLVKILKGLYKSREIFRTEHIRMDYLQDKALVRISKPGAGTRS
jgi:hypothetical protein